MKAENQPKNQKSALWMGTSFQKTVSAGIAASGLILTISLIAGVAVYFLLNNTEKIFSSLLYCVLVFIAGLVYLVYSIHKMDTANQFYDKLVVIWKYNPSFVYQFKKYTAFMEKPYKSINYFCASLCFAVLSVIVSLNPEQPVLSVFLFILTGLCLFVALINLPVINIYALRVKNLLFGTAQSVILSRSGVYSFGKIYKFGQNSFTFHKAYKKQMGVFDTLTFTYQRMRGYQVLLREINIPIPPETSQEEINELLALYNSSDLYMNDTI